MRQVVDDCGNEAVGAFRRRAEIFLFQMNRRSQKLIAGLLRAHKVGALRYGKNNSDYLEDGRENV